MTPAHLRTGARAGALTSVLIVLCAAPAGALSQQAGLSPGCARSDGGRVTCTYTKPTTSPLHVNVPAGVTSAVMTLRGGAGGAGAIQVPEQVPGLTQSPGGPGGTASASTPVSSDQGLVVRVGGAGQSGIAGGGGGLGGGGNGNAVTFLTTGLAGGGGGGGSEVRFAGSNPGGADPLIAAGGGGGGGSGFLGLQVPVVHPGPGGAGGGTTGAPAPGIDIGDGVFGGGGGGGTATAGGGTGGVVVPGLPPVMGGSGVRGQGGDAGMLSIPKMFEGGMGGGGGGGGGYFGGAAGSLFAGGGGGSGFGPAGTTFGTAPATGAVHSDGAVVIVFGAPRGEGSADTGTRLADHVGTPKAATTVRIGRELRRV